MSYLIALLQYTNVPVILLRCSPVCSFLQLSLAYFYLGEEIYAKAALDKLRMWYTDAINGMLPNVSPPQDACHLR